MISKHFLNNSDMTKAKKRLSMKPILLFPVVWFLLASASHAQDIPRNWLGISLGDTCDKSRKTPSGEGVKYFYTTCNDDNKIMRIDLGLYSKNYSFGKVSELLTQKVGKPSSNNAMKKNEFKWSSRTTFLGARQPKIDVTDYFGLLCNNELACILKMIEDQRVTIPTAEVIIDRGETLLNITILDHVAYQEMWRQKHRKAVANDADATEAVNKLFN